jgi:hypothetical protein
MVEIKMEPVLNVRFNGLKNIIRNIIKLIPRHPNNFVLMATIPLLVAEIDGVVANNAK